MNVETDADVVKEPDDVASNIRSISSKKPSTVDLKREAHHQERKRRFINRGMTPAQADMAMAEEDYRNLPIERKFERFQAGVSQAFQKMAHDILGLRHNDGVIADAIDVNVKAMAKCLEKVGVNLEQQSEIIKAVSQEIAEERKQRIEEAKRRIQVEAESKAASEALAGAEKSSNVTDSDDAPQPVVPDGATTFGE